MKTYYEHVAWGIQIKKNVVNNSYKTPNEQTNVYPFGVANLWHISNSILLLILSIRPRWSAGLILIISDLCRFMSHGVNACIRLFPRNVNAQCFCLPMSVYSFSREFNLCATWTREYQVPTEQRSENLRCQRWQGWQKERVSKNHWPKGRRVQRHHQLPQERLLHPSNSQADREKCQHCAASEKRLSLVAS